MTNWIYSWGIIVAFACVSKTNAHCKFMSNASKPLNVCWCNCKNDCSGGKCTECENGWSGSRKFLCQRENMVFQQKTEQSDTYDNHYNSAKAVDNDPSTYSFVRRSDSAAWWRSATKKLRHMSSVDVILDLEANATYSIYITDKSLVTNQHSFCASIQSVTDMKRTNRHFQCQQERFGNIVEIQAQAHFPLKIYDVKVLTCDNGTFGTTCGRLCPDRCHMSCNRTTGECDQCESGMMGSFCNNTCPSTCTSAGCDKQTGRCYECSHGRSGEDCQYLCPDGCATPCQRHTGLCRTCKKGFYGEYCVRCLSGFYGQGCRQSCISSCKGGCDSVTGTCTECQYGFFGEFCSKPCPVKCQDLGCSKGTGECFNCNGHFTGKDCTSCVIGKYGKNCSNDCQRCHDNECDSTTGICFKCIRGKHGTFCDKDCPIECKISGCDRGGRCLPCWDGLSNCQSNCTFDKCKTCEYDNGSCSQCVEGWYGYDCTSECPSDCTVGCHIQNGTCLSYTAEDDYLEFDKTSANSKGIPKILTITIIVATLVLLTISGAFLVKICHLRQQRNKALVQLNYEHRCIASNPNRDISSHNYQSVHISNEYENEQRNEFSLSTSSRTFDKGACSFDLGDNVEYENAQSSKKVTRFSSVSIVNNFQVEWSRHEESPKKTLSKDDIRPPKIIMRMTSLVDSRPKCSKNGEETSHLSEDHPEGIAGI